MKIEKGQTFVLNAEKPYVVGIVSSIKDSKQERFVIKTTEGEELIWNNKSKKFSDDVEYDALSEETLLVAADDEESCDCCSECDCCTDEEDTSIGLETGDVWSEEDGDSYLIVELHRPAVLFGREYKFRGLSLSDMANINPVAYFDDNGVDAMKKITLVDYVGDASDIFE